MNTLNLQIPDSYHTAVQNISVKDNISINQFIISAIAEKIAAFETRDYLEARAEKGSRKDFMAVLNKVPAIPPAEQDR
ncbi:MAG: hypothetical protein IKO57_07555 [Treponema sp.]|nr:hypothetical protein [Treponema sp.]